MVTKTPVSKVSKALKPFVCVILDAHGVIFCCVLLFSDCQAASKPASLRYGGMPYRRDAARTDPVRVALPFFSRLR